MPGIFQPFFVTVAGVYLYWVIVGMHSLYCLFAVCFMHQFCLPLTVVFTLFTVTLMRSWVLIFGRGLRLCRNQTKIEGHLKLVDAPRSMVGLIDYLLLRAVVLTSFLVPQEFLHFFFSLQAQPFICKGIVSISSSDPVYFLMECFRTLAKIWRDKVFSFSLHL